MIATLRLSGFATEEDIHILSEEWVHVREQRQANSVEHRTDDENSRRNGARPDGGERDEEWEHHRTVTAKPFVLSRRQRHPQVHDHEEAVRRAQASPHKRYARDDGQTGKTVQR